MSRSFPRPNATITPSIATIASASRIGFSSAPDSISPILRMTSLPGAPRPTEASSDIVRSCRFRRRATVRLGEVVVAVAYSVKKIHKRLLLGGRQWREYAARHFHAIGQSPYRKSGSPVGEADHRQPLILLRPTTL